jgi:hypothetical protein
MKNSHLSLFNLALSMLLMLGAFGQNGNWNQSISFNPSLSILTIETNAGFDYVGRPDQEMPYGIIPKSLLVPQSKLQWGGGFQYSLSNQKNGLILEVSGKSVFSLNSSFEENSVFLELSHNFQFYTLQLGLGYDFLPKKPDEDLMLLVSGGGVYHRYVTGHKSYPNGEPTTPFQEVGEERFVRKGFALSWGLQLRWTDYFSAHWGYSVFGEYNGMRVEPTKMRMTRFLVNSQDQLGTLTTREREYVFGNTANDNPADSTIPKVLPTEFYDYRFYTIGVGVNYRF